MDKREYITIAILVGMFAVSFALLPSMPEKVPMHWNAEGQVDGYGGSDSIFLLPIVTLGLYALFVFLPKLAVHKKNILDFYKKHGFGFKLVFILFMAAIQAVILLTALNNQVQMNYVMPILLAGLFVYLGYVMKDIKRNYFIGFRTPWALADDKNWKKTHEFGGKMFILAGALVGIVGIFGLNVLWWLAVILIPVAAVFIYSYREFKSRR